MSEYQYYEFQAIDRPLSKGQQETLRALSSRARITATSFTNSYQWGDFRGDPKRLMESYFDLHLYLANWGARRLMIRAPKRLVDPHRLTPFLSEIDWVDVQVSGSHVILDICRDEVGRDDDLWDGSGWLASLAPLRADLLSGDWRMFYLLWLTAVEEDLLPDDVQEPLPGLGPLTGPLEAFAEFFEIDHDLLQAAAERPASGDNHSPKALRAFLKGLPEDEKTELLARLMEGDAHIAAELRSRARKQTTGGETLRTVGALRAKAARRDREQAEKARREEERRRKSQEVEKARRARLDALKRRGEAAWKEVETQIELRNASGYERAVELLRDLKMLASEQGAPDNFSRRLQDICERHARKRQFIMRVEKL